MARPIVHDAPALVHCPLCQKEISAQAESCPQCGEPGARHRKPCPKCSCLYADWQPRGFNLQNALIGAVILWGGFFMLFSMFVSVDLQSVARLLGLFFGAFGLIFGFIGMGRRESRCRGCGYTP